ncbi:hypothetical protein [Curtobacterium citreum]|uniref:Uncharacterized protein n=1 Tax=Curtobacterium citreum TaxID=2036 RepID=A0ABU8Y5J8_9MICO
MNSPNRLTTPLERRIIALRVTWRLGPNWIAFHIHLARGIAGRILARFQNSLLNKIAQATELPVRLPAPVRYENSRPCELAR